MSGSVKKSRMAKGHPVTRYGALTPIMTRLAICRAKSRQAVLD